MCHGELQLHYSYDTKLNFALLSHSARRSFISFRSLPFLKWIFYQRNVHKKARGKRENVNFPLGDENPHTIWRHIQHRLLVFRLIIYRFMQFFLRSVNQKPQKSNKSHRISGIEIWNFFVLSVNFKLRMGNYLGKIKSWVIEENVHWKCKINRQI